jgi:hypothetical protein
MDRTSHTLDAPTEGERTCSLTIGRTPLEPGDELDALVTRIVRRGEVEMLGHEVLHRTERVIAGEAGIDLAVRWRGPRSMLYTRQAHLAAGGLWVVFGITGWLEDATICDHHLDRLIETLRLRPSG